MRWALALVLLSGCLDFDWAVWNGIPCSTVDADTCHTPDRWDEICDRCDQPYDFTRDYDWYPGTLAEGQTVRPALDVEQLAIPTADGLGTLDAYYVPSHREDPAVADTLIVYSHGNYAGLEAYLVRIRFLHEAGFAVLAWDYRGYGKSLPVDAPTAEQLVADAHTVRATADAYAADPSRIVIYGYSIGSLAATEMATSSTSCALVLESPFPGFREVGQASTSLDMPEGFFSTGLYDNVRKLQGFDRPFFLMAGEDDALFPPEAIQPLIDGVEGPSRRWIVPGTGHGIGGGGGVPEAGLTAYFTHLRSFLEERAPGCLQAPTR